MIKRICLRDSTHWYEEGLLKLDTLIEEGWRPISGVLSFPVTTSGPFSSYTSYSDYIYVEKR